MKHWEGGSDQTPARGWQLNGHRRQPTMRRLRGAHRWLPRERRRYLAPMRTWRPVHGGGAKGGTAAAGVGTSRMAMLGSGELWRSARAARRVAASDRLWSGPAPLY
jgi:hypothetical protein